jgi:hypothetical protein
VGAVVTRIGIIVYALGLALVPRTGSREHGPGHEANYEFRAYLHASRSQSTNGTSMRQAPGSAVKTTKLPCFKVQIEGLR